MSRDFKSQYVNPRLTSRYQLHTIKADTRVFITEFTQLKQKTLKQFSNKYTISFSKSSKIISSADSVISEP